MKIILYTLLLLVSLINVQADLYTEFNDFASQAFGAEKDTLIYEKFGNILNQPFDYWIHTSQTSASIGFTTNLPANSYIEYGTSTSYDLSTEPTDRKYYQHLHWIKGLNSGTTYHYRVVLEDERGNIVYGDDRTITPETITGVIRIPEDLNGPPYVLSSEGAYYLVTQDLNIPGKAFEIDADGIILDLGGNTITYNEEYLEISGDWPYYITNAYYGVRAQGPDNYKILNGKIKQGLGNNSAHLGVSIGFNPLYLNGASGIEVAGIELEYYTNQMVGQYMHWPGGVNEIHHNVYKDRGWEISNRHGTGSRAVTVTGDADSLYTHHNLVKRTRQGGLLGGHLHDNEIYLDSYATNSFGLGPSDFSEVYDNKIFGTGYHVIGIGWGNKRHYYNNFVHLHGQGPDWRYPEYGNQESLNGFRQTQYAGSHRNYSDNHYHDNLILITGGQCNGDDCTECRGIQHASDYDIRNNIIENNTIKVDMNPEITQAAAVVTQGLRDRCGTEFPVLWKNNKLISNIVNVRMGDYYAAGCNHHFISNTFEKIGYRNDYRTFRFDVYWDMINHYVFDGTFIGGASLDSLHFQSAGQEFNVGYTLTVNVKTNGIPLDGATVIINKQDGKRVAEGITKNGRFESRLVEYQHTQAGKEYYTPHKVMVMYDGNVKIEYVTINETKAISIEFNEECSQEGSQRACGISEGTCEEGIQICNNGIWGECVNSVIPIEELCNNLDDDCDGQTDEELGSTTCGLGICTNTINNCENGIAQVCDPFLGQLQEDIVTRCSNNLDDNCLGDGDSLCESLIVESETSTEYVCEITNPLGIQSIILINNQEIVGTNELIAEKYFFLEAESFEYDNQEWNVCPGENCQSNRVTSTNFASGLAHAVTDESGGGQIPMIKNMLLEPDTYYFWARSLQGNYLRSLQISVNQELFPEILGNEGSGDWEWEYVGNRNIGGNVQIEINDAYMDAYWGFSDLVLITTNPDFNPNTNCGIDASDLNYEFPYQYGFATCGLSEQTEIFSFNKNDYGTLTDWSCGFKDSAGNIVTEGGIIDNPGGSNNIYDLDHDGIVGIEDLYVLALYFGSNTGPDFNNDGITNILDMIILIENY